MAAGFGLRPALAGRNRDRSHYGYPAIQGEEGVFGTVPFPFDDLLARASDTSLQLLVGRDVVRLLARLDPQLVEPTVLRSMLLELMPPSEMLLRSDLRSELLYLLPPHAAGALARVLGVDGGEPYGSLAKMKILRGSGTSRSLLDFFSVAEPSTEMADEKAPSECVRPSHGLFAHQREAAKEVRSYLESDPPRVLLHMPTGSGKTRTAMNIVARTLVDTEPGLVVWLAHSEELCEQAVEEFTNAWRALGNREVSVQRWWGKYELDARAVGDGLVVAGLAKAHASLRRSLAEVGGLAGRVSLIVMDEAHQAIAPSYQAILDLLAHAGIPTPLLGLSATPGRSWSDIDEDERLANFFQKQKVTLKIHGFNNPIDFLVADGYLASARFDSLLYKSGVTLTERDLREISEGLDVPTRVLKLLAEDEQRNLLVVSRVEQMLKRHKRMIVFAATVEHAVVLAAVLRARGLWAHAVTGQTPASERARLIEAYKSDEPAPRVLVNYGVLTTGFDAPLTSAAVIARPTTSLVLYSQMVGRAIRGPKAGGSANAEIATVVDLELPGFASLADAFHNWEDVWT